MHNNQNIRSIVVDKKDLLNSLRKNRDIHKQEYQEMQATYKIEVIKELKNLIKRAKNDNIQTRINLVAPSDYTETYDEVIGMLEMSIESNLTISADEYRKYVMNKWSWSENFDMLKTTYIG